MPLLTELFNRPSGQPFVVCDISPPRAGDAESLEDLSSLKPDMFAAAYNPGKGVSANSAFVAAWMEMNTLIPTLFMLATRDMNRIDAQSILLGSHLFGLRNVVSVMGDKFSEEDANECLGNYHLPATEMIRSIKQMNQGYDFRGRSLRRRTNLCVGSTINLSRDLDREVTLTLKKDLAGSDFFITQPLYRASQAVAFMEKYEELTGGKLTTPIVWGIQMMIPGGISFAEVPYWVTRDLSRSRGAVDIAMEVIRDFVASGFQAFYIVPPIHVGGARDYGSAAALLEGINAG